MTDFAGRTALITGGARGQGRSHAIALAARGANIVICDRCSDSPAVPYPLATPEDLAETVRLVEEQGQRCIAVQANTADHGAMVDLVARATEEFGSVDIAIANAGVSVNEFVQAMTPEQWNEVISSNLTGVFNTLSAVSPGMIERGYGRIVTVSSMMGRGSGPSLVGYSASKWGVIGMSKSAALDLAGHGITVNVVAPGNVSTPMVHNDALYARMRPDLEKPTRDDVAPIFKMLHGQPVPFIEPEEITHAVLFLIDDASAHITGTVLPVDAGAAARVTG